MTAFIFRLFLCVLLFVGCASTRYEPPKIDQSDVWAEYQRQNAERKKEYRERVKANQERIIRLSNLSWPIRVAAAKFSEKTQTTYEFGFSVTSPNTWKGESEPYKREVLWEEYGTLNERSALSVWHVVKGSSAEKAGMRVGDKIVAINNKTFKSYQDFRNKRIRSSHLFIHDHYVPKDIAPVVAFTVKRDTSTISISASPRRISKFQTRLLHNRTINAFANGVAVYVPTGLMEWVESDAELQFVIAHELAHNIEKHIEKTEHNILVASMIGRVLDNVVGSYTELGYLGLSGLGRVAGRLRYSQAFEIESDYLAMYFLANADIDTRLVTDIWRKMNDVSENSGDYSLTHPSYPERTIYLLATDKEIKEKKSARMALTPNK